jgi:hypothetical protein
MRKARSAPLNRPVFSLDELAPIPGLDPLLLDALKAYFTPYPMFPGANGGGVNLNTAPAHVLGLIYHGVAEEFELVDQRDVFEILKARSEGKVFCAGAAQEPCTDFAATVGIAAGETIFPPLTFTVSSAKLALQVVSALTGIANDASWPARTLASRAAAISRQRPQRSELPGRLCMTSCESSPARRAHSLRSTSFPTR